MTREILCSKIDEAVAAFHFPGAPVNRGPYGSGHINDTFLIETERPDGKTSRCILQRINHEIFKQPLEVIENVDGVTSFLFRKIKAAGGDADRQTLNLIPAKSGGSYHKDSIGSWWRAYHFLEGTVSLDRIERPEQFYQSAVAFGKFQSLLSDYPAATLHETIPHFHDTPDRFRKFRLAVEADACGRAASVREEISFYLEREAFTHILMNAQARGELPLRVTHNDTKLNNVMFDEATGEAVCVIDLDTVMPGFSVNDFGDSIRFGASTGDEDEPDLSKVNLDLELFDLYTRGYLDGCGGSLTPLELELLPTGAKMMTLECGMRFLTDYLEGDTYFRIHREGQNLDRCRTQIKLVKDMEQHWDEMAAIVAKNAARQEETV